MFSIIPISPGFTGGYSCFAPYGAVCNIKPRNIFALIRVKKSLLLRPKPTFFLAGVGLGFDDVEGFGVGELSGFLALRDLVVVLSQLDVGTPASIQNLDFWIFFKGFDVLVGIRLPLIHN